MSLDNKHFSHHTDFQDLPDNNIQVMSQHEFQQLVADFKGDPDGLENFLSELDFYLADPAPLYEK
ncbi:MAG: hypothetical protein WCJ84_04795 [Candidatus Peregrinibacteria bacterium]